jgi:hypothetical protein
MFRCSIMTTNKPRSKGQDFGILKRMFSGRMEGKPSGKVTVGVLAAIRERRA